MRTPAPQSGTVESFNKHSGYGYIVPDRRTPQTKPLLVHRHSLRDPATALTLSRGQRVLFTTKQVHTGLLADDVRLDDSIEEHRPLPAASSSSDNYIAQAMLARERKDYDSARAFYKLGTSHSPSHQLFLSYAAFEKMLHRNESAMEVYKHGIAQYPDLAKLREDAGVCAFRMGQTDVAIAFLQSALDICKRTQQQGEVAVLTALARAYAKKGALQKAMGSYRAAHKLFRQRSRQLPSSDVLAMNLIQIRLQHPRGELLYRFLQKCGFEISSVPSPAHIGTKADMFVRTESNEIQESYGISGNIFVRCMFQKDLTMADLSGLDTDIEGYRRKEILDAQVVVLLVLASLPDAVRGVLYERIDRNNKPWIIVPITEQTMERSDDSLAALRDILNTWLYRRDLFAEKAPVVGKLFFGRNQIMAELMHSIASSKPTGIFGLRKVGKTSLMLECARHARADGDLVAYIDLQTLPSDVNDTRWLYWRIANLLFQEVQNLKSTSVSWRLGGEYESILDVPSDFPVATAFSADMEALISAIDRGRFGLRPRIVILLDEIERIVPTRLGKEGFRGFFEFFGYLRGVAQESRNLVVIVTGANPSIVEVSQFNGRDNPVFNFFGGIYLQLLKRQEVESMVCQLGRGMGISFDTVARRHIFDLLGGHPYLTREFCSLLTKKKKERPADIVGSDIESFVDEYLRLESNGFQEIADRLARDYPKELDLCVDLAQSDVPVPLNKLAEDAASGQHIKHLSGYQLASVADDGKVSLTMKLFRTWLLRWLGGSPHGE